MQRAYILARKTPVAQMMVLIIHTSDGGASNGCEAIEELVDWVSQEINAIYAANQTISCASSSARVSLSHDSSVSS